MPLFGLRKLLPHRTIHSSGLFGGSLADIPSPTPQDLDDLRRYCCCKWDSDEDEGLVNGVSKC